MRYCNAGHPPPLLLRADGGEEALSGGGLPLGVDSNGEYAERELEFAPGDTLFAATDGLLEARRERSFFGDARLPELLAEHGRTLEPQALAELAQTEAERWAAHSHDDVAVLVVRRTLPAGLQREPADGAAAQALFGEYMAFVRERLGPAFKPLEAIFATEGAFEEAGAAFLVLYEGERPIGCGGVRMLSADVAEIKRMFVTGPARRHGHGRRLLGELERLAAAAGARRVRLLTTEALREALELYATAGYREVEAFERDGRRDAWLEKRLPMEMQ
jgi:N-acetylglutamate synthase-like GNAT family acetyltransferase